MLRDYGRKASIYKWCCKSAFSSSMNFETPNQLNLFQETPIGYIHICSKLANLATHHELTEEKTEELSKMVAEFNYRKDLGFNRPAAKEGVLARLEEMTRAKKNKLSKQTDELLKFC